MTIQKLAILMGLSVAAMIVLSGLNIVTSQVIFLVDTGILTIIAIAYYFLGIKRGWIVVAFVVPVLTLIDWASNYALHGWSALPLIGASVVYIVMIVTASLIRFGPSPN